MNAAARRWVDALGMRPHPEGGFYRETWRAADAVATSALPVRFAGDRTLGTAIVYLLPEGERSHLHRLHADEVWHLYDGGPLHLHLLVPGRGHERLVLGKDVEHGESPQVVVPHGTWFGAETAEGAGYVLVGCTTSPGFEFADFEMGEREALLAEFPAERAWIERLTAAKG